MGAIPGYLIDLVKAMFPFVWSWLLPSISGVRIKAPYDGGTVPKQTVPVTGTFRHTCGLRFVLMHKVGKGYYPQGGPDFNWSRKEWSKDVRIGNEPGREYSIVLAIVNDDAATVIDYYYHLGNTKNIYEAIPLYRMPKGIQILQTVIVTLSHPAGEPVKDA